MLTGRAGCSQPQSIEQARQDFKIYMSKLLEHGAALDAFRPEARHPDVGDAESGGPAWGPPLRGLSGEEGGSAAGGTKGSPATSFAFSPSYFREEHAWPRAGVVTPPRPRPPLNFSWMAEPPTLGGGEGVGGGEGGGGSGGGATERSLFSASAPPSLAPPPSEGGGRGGHSNEYGTATTRGRGRVVGGGGEEEGGGGDEWKARWSRRLLRGPIHSEYQARFPWPPRSALNTTGAVHAPPSAPVVQRRGRSTVAAASASNTAAEAGAESGALMTPPPHQARSVSPLWGRGRGRGRGRDRGAREEESVGNLGARGASEPPRDRRAAADSPRIELRPSPSVDAAAVQHDGTERLSGDKAAAGRRAGDFAEGIAVGAPAPAVSSVDEEQVGKDEAPRAGDAAVAHRARSEGLGMEAVGDHEQDGSGRRCSGGIYDGRERAGWRDHVGGGDTGLPSRAAGADDYGYPAAAGASAVGRAGGEVWRERAAGRGETTMASGGQTLDYSCQSILTEYMDEFAWPSNLPAPGRRGKRTGMGADHVGRLLAGKRAEEPRRAPDPGVVARLGAAADGALRAGSPGHLSEMCRLKSPSPACRRLVLGLVIALGLRWRRWGDIRSRLLGNKPELVGFLKNFDKDRPGLTSATLRPFTEDPSLAPAQVTRVAACLVWVARWLRALHDYLAAKEGNIIGIDTNTASLFQASASAGLPHGAPARRLHKSTHGHSRAHGASSGSALGLGAPEKAAERRGRPSGASVVAGHQRMPAEAARRPPTAAKGAPAAQQVGRRHDDASNDGDESRDTRSNRRPSHAAATRGDGSSRPPLSTTTPHWGDVGGAGSRGDGGRGGKVGGDEAAGASFAESSGGGGLNSESQWTAGTVTSRGDVLGAPTDDQLDLGSGVGAQHDEENARTVRRRYNDGAGASSSSVGVPASGGGAAPSTISARVAGTTMTSDRVLKGDRRGSSRRELSRSSRRGLSWGPQASHACIYRHKHKARTPSHFANPKARRPTRARKDPILANTRWPPPVVVRACDRTEQRSAFSLEHSFLAYE